MPEGDGAIHGAGSKASRPIVVEVTDETGRPVEGVAVSFRMPEEGPGASFGQGMKTDIRITGPDGKAMVHEFTAGRVAGPYQVRVTAVKSQVRAGVVVSQYVSDGPVKAAGVKRSGGSKKWLAIAVIAAGAASGVAFGAMGGGSTPASVSRPVALPPVPPSIGSPTISVGGPQ